MDTAETRIRSGDTVRKFAAACRERLGHSARWGWAKRKSTPGFPQPIYIDGSPHLIDREIDEYLARCAGEKIAA